MHFLQALIAAIVTGAVGFGLSLIPVKRDRITDRKPNRQLYAIWACAAFAITLIADWIILAADIASFRGAYWLIFLIVSLVAIYSGFVIADALQDRSSWSTCIAAVVLVALLVLMVILLLLQLKHNGITAT